MGQTKPDEAGWIDFAVGPRAQSTAHRACALPLPQQAGQRVGPAGPLQQQRPLALWGIDDPRRWWVPHGAQMPPYAVQSG